MIHAMTRPSDFPRPDPLSGSIPATRPLHEATELTAGGSLADIHLQGQVYTLRITRAGKLILTK